MGVLKVKASPYDYRFDPKHTALMIIDFQKDFLLKDGFGEVLGNDVSRLQKAVKPTKKVLEGFRKKKLFILHTREGHKPHLSDCPKSKITRGNLKSKIGDQGPMGRILIRGEKGHDIIDELKPIKNEVVIDKSGKDAFYNTDLDKILKAKNIKYLIITGVTTEVCVQSTVRGANDRGYEVLVLEDCVASYKPLLHKAALKMITSQRGIFGWVSYSKELLKSITT